MDLNITTTALLNNQENELLLNAIKNKFATQTTNETTAAFSPPKFNIPNLKIPTKATENTNKKATETTNALGTTPLNQFLLQQLQQQQQHNNDKGNTGFVLPQLHGGNKLHNDAEGQTRFELPLLKSSTATPISTLTTALQNLQVGESSALQTIPIPTTPAIDLTTALASKLTQHQGTPPTRDLSNNKTNISEDFVIPFIECDRLDVSRIILATANEYCLTDISQLVLNPSDIEPSCIGRILDIDNKYVAPLPLKCFTNEYQHQHVKHTIVPFQFDTKSPDDLVLESLSKFHRRYFN